MDFDYFSQNLLPQYQHLHGQLPGLYYDPRGVLYEPHTGKSIPLGTREIEGYAFPEWLYNKILYIEKKGLWPIIEASRLAERYDMAVIAAERVCHCGGPGAVRTSTTPQRLSTLRAA